MNKTKTYTAIILFTFLATQNFLASNQDELVIVDYSYKDGLTTNSVNHIFQDSRGFLWISSINGLYRYDGYVFQKFSSRSPLLNGEIYSVSEDDKKNLWIATSKRGIVYYNTHTEEIFPLKLSISTNYNIFRILLFKGKVWVASDSGILVFDQQEKYPPEKEIHTRVLFPNPEDISAQTNKINCLFAYPNTNIIWVGSNGGLFTLNTEKLYFTFISSHPQNSIRHFNRFKNYLIAGSWDGGILLINPNTLNIEKNEFYKKVNSVIGNKRVISIFTDHQNQLWTATYGDGLFIFNEKGDNVSSINYKNDENISIRSNIINYMLQDRDGIVWLCMNQPALTKIYYQKNFLTPYHPIKAVENKPFEFSTVYQSNQPNYIWLSTNNNGIFLYDFATHTTRHFTSQSSSALLLPSNEVSFCYEDKKGNLWILFRKKGVYVLPASKTLQLLAKKNYSSVKPIDISSLLFETFYNSYITFLYEDERDRLWMGMWGTLYLLTFEKGFTESQTLEDIKKTCHVSCIYTDKRPHEVNFSISPIQSIIQINNQEYWLGTRNAGIITMKEVALNRFIGRPLDEVNKILPSNYVKSFYIDNTKKIWIGTNMGICVYDIQKKSHKIISEGHGLSSENISNIIGDSRNNVWVSSSYGISSISNTTYNIKNYLFNIDKINYNFYMPNANAMSLPSGHLCFATNQVLVTIHPDSVENDTTPPSLYFTDIRINNQTITPQNKIKGVKILTQCINEADKITIPYNSALTLDFAALNYSHNDQIKYKYRLNNNEWITLSNNHSLILQNLNANEYTLEIMATNAMGISSSRKIKLVFLPPFWKTKIAYLIYLSLLTFLFFSYRHLIIQRIKEKTEKEKEVFERMKLQELDKLKTDFLTNIAHEIRTPLSLIINPLETIVQNNDLPQNTKEKIQVTLKNSYRLVKLTNELSDFTKIEKDLIKPEFKYLDIISVVKEVYSMFEEMAHAMHIEYKFYSLYTNLKLYFDKEMLEKVIFNLLSNAFKFTPKNGVIIVEIALTSEYEKQFCKISITNTGEGIQPQNLSRIFDRYYQVNQTSQGLGIGLSIVKSIIELHGGKITVKSIPNVDTSFDVFLPVQIPENIHMDESTNNQEEIFVPQKKFKNSKTDILYKILLVEDDTDISEFVKSELSSHFKVITASNGKEGYQLANEILPDLILTDIIMPEMDGIAMCKLLKNQITTSHIPIIILSAKATVEQQIEGLDTGADIYMVKPFNIFVLKHQIQSLLQLKENIYQKILKEIDFIPKEAVNTSIDQKFIENLISFIEQHISDINLNVDQLAHHVNLSRIQLYRKIKAITGLSVIEFITSIRLKIAAKMILEKQYTYSQIAYETGFSSPSYFTKCFREHFGKTPSEYEAIYRKNG